MTTAENKSEIGGAIFGLLVLGLLIYGGWAGYSELKEHFVSKSAASDPRDQQIKELSEKVAALEAKPKAEHHYEFRNEGSRTWRFDPATGASCIQLATKGDWKQPDTIRQGCQYEDWANGDGASRRDYYSAECVLLGNKKACDEIATASDVPIVK